MAAPLITPLQVAEPAYIQGQLNDTSVAKAIASIERGARRIVITSGGGDARAAMRLGDVLTRYRVALTIRGYCFSGCASYLFPAASQVTIEPHALVAFHDTISSMLQLQAPGYQDAARRFYGAADTTEARFYARRGLAQRLLILPMFMLHPLCAGTIATEDSPQTPFSISQYQVYFPTLATLRKYNPNILGHVAATTKELQSDLATSLPNARALSFTFGGDTGQSTQVMVRSMQGLPACQLPNR